jgi:hypothetical protein
MKELAPGTIRNRHQNVKDFDPFVVVDEKHWREFRNPGDKIGPARLRRFPIIGRLPPSELDATEWDYRYKLPKYYDPEKHYLYWGTCGIRGWSYSSPDWFNDHTDSLEKYIVERPPEEGLSETQKWLLKINSEWADKLQDFAQRHATGGAGQDTCDVTIKTALAWKEQLATERAAREKAEQDVVRLQTVATDRLHDLNYNCKQWKKEVEARQEAEKSGEAAEKRIQELIKSRMDHWQTAQDVRQAFRAATGQDYEPGRKYSMPKLKPGDRFRFLTFPEDYGVRPTCLDIPFVMGEEGKARYESQAGFLWPVEGCTYEILDSETPTQKEPPMPKLKPGDRFRFLTMPEYWGDRDRGSDIVWRVKACGTEGEREDGVNAAECSIKPGMDIEILSNTPQKETPMSPKDLPVGAVFRHPEAKEYKGVWWVNDGNGKCHKQDDPSYITSIGDAPYVTKGAFMSKSKVFGKYAALFVLFSALSNPTDIWQGAKDWYTAPTQLELGDWTRVTSCKDCSAVVPKVDVGGAGANIPPAICPKCGGEDFEQRKAQVIRQAAKWDGRSGDGFHRGYRFADGTTTVEPGNWEMP